ncbi:MAG: hypothetical protein K8L97_13945 [Anaerolineae bacterium]|nr:hypothetical protein [Anaerolineae bacterium]
MSVQADWFDPEQKNIIRYEFVGSWTWDDLYAAMNQVNTLMASVDHTVYIIIDFRQGRGVPGGALTHMRSSTMRAADNWGGGVFLGINTFLQALVSTFIKVYPRLGDRYHTAKTLEEALTIIDVWQSKALTQTP